MGVDPTPAAGAPGSGVILVLDDEPGILRFTMHVLKNAGYQVTGAGDGQQGLEIIDRDPAAVAAVVMDLSMPGMDGRTLAAELRRRLPGVPVLVMSGYSDAEVAGRLAGTGVTHFVHKPFRPADLTGCLSQALARQSAEGEPD